MIGANYRNTFDGRGYHTTHNRVVGHVIKSIRTRLRSDEQEVARLIGMSLDTYLKVEKGTKVLSLNEFMLWCDNVNVKYGCVLDLIRHIESLLTAGHVRFTGKNSMLSTQPLPFDVIDILVKSSNIESPNFIVTPGVVFNTR